MQANIERPGDSTPPDPEPTTVPVPRQPLDDSTDTAATEGVTDPVGEAGAPESLDEPEAAEAGGAAGDPGTGTAPGPGGAPADPGPEAEAGTQPAPQTRGPGGQQRPPAP